jgi:energy-coupling factor transporter ATP-binding protein EcfA2
MFWKKLGLKQETKKPTQKLSQKSAKGHEAIDEEKMMRGHNMVTQLFPWEVRDDGILVTCAGKEHKFKKTISVIIRVWEPDCSLSDYGDRHLFNIKPIEVLMRTEESVGKKQQLQIVRFSKPAFENALINETLSTVQENNSVANQIFVEHAKIWQKSGNVPDIRTFLILSFDFADAWIEEEKFHKQVRLLKNRANRLALAFSDAQYRCEILKEPQAVMQMLWEYFNPVKSVTIPAPTPRPVPKGGQFNEASVKRDPALTPDSLRKQLVTSPYEFGRDWVFGDGMYRAFLYLGCLPKQSLSGFAPLYQLDLDLVITQYWSMEGINDIAGELEKSQLWGDELRKDFGDRMSNSKLQKDIDNIEELKDAVTEAENLLKFKFMVCVQSKTLQDLEEGVSKVESCIAGIEGATMYREMEPTRLKRCLLESAPGCPKLRVDYSDGRAHVLQTNRAVWFLPRYGTPPSDGLSKGTAFSTAWATNGNLVRKIHWGKTAGNIVLGFGTPGTGKSWYLKMMAMTLSLHVESCGVRIWSIDNNAALTSFDFINKMLGGEIIRFSDEKPVSLPTFDIAGDKPTSEERRYLVASIWLDIYGESAPALDPAFGSVLSSAITQMYKLGSKPNYDNLVQILREWAMDSKYRQYRQSLIYAATSLERFCTGEYLSFIKEIPDHPNGDYYEFFGQTEGLRLHDLIDVPIVSWNLEGLGDGFLRKKVGLLLKKMMMSFGRLLGQRSSNEGRPFSLEVLIDEGWETLAIDGGDFLNQINRRHRHIRSRLYFFTQNSEDLRKDVGIIIRNNASHWIILSTGRRAEDEMELLGLTQVEAERCAELRRVKNVYGEFLYRRKLDNSAIESQLLLNVMPCTDDGSWIAALTGDREECNVREMILHELGAQSLLSAQQWQCQLAFEVMGKVWPRGLPHDGEKDRLTRDEGWPIAQKLIQEKLARQVIARDLSERERSINEFYELTGGYVNAAE